MSTGTQDLIATSASSFVVSGNALILNPYAAVITANATTTPTSATCYVSCVVIMAATAGTTSTITVQDKSGTPLKVINLLTTVAASLSPMVINFATPIKMTGGIDIVTAGAVAATNHVWINYYQ
jgi:hypothetical protein